MSKEQEYIYIMQSLLEPTTCKIGKTGNLDERLNTYNRQTGKSKANNSQYLFTCEVSDMTQVENDIKNEFKRFKEKKATTTEIYLFNEYFFADYVNFIKTHPLFIKEEFIKKEELKVTEKIIKRETPSLKERKLTPRDIMQRAKKVENDEFYTQYEDVEKEIEMYDKNIWKDKCVFCNCDDAVGNDETRTSAFALYFLQNFKKLKLKKLICTHYGGGADIFFQGARGYIFTIDGFSVIKADNYDDFKLFPTGYDGSFDHPISLKILNEEADIVCTNPPFSRAKDYWKLIIESGKNFLIISNFTNVKNVAYIHYFMDNRVWAGHNEVYWFLNPSKQIVKAAGHWYTNLPVINRLKYKNLKIMPLKNIPEKYKKFDDSGTLLVDFNYIPDDYEKPFAVSVFPILSGILEKGFKIVQAKQYRPFINGREVFARVLIQKELK